MPDRSDSSTALKLARAGIPVLVLDCEPDIIRSPRAIVYHAPTVEMLDRLGLLDELKVAGILKQDYQFRTVDGEILAAPHMSVLTPEDTAYPYNLHHAAARACRHRSCGISSISRAPKCAGIRASPASSRTPTA